MNANEEIIYSAMGLDPILLLDEPPLSENYTVNIVRPGLEVVVDKKNEISEENEQNTLINSNAKNNNKDVIRLKNNPIAQKATNSAEAENVEEPNISVYLGEDLNELVNPSNNSINEKDELNVGESQEVNEDPRRKRRRSSASS